MTDLQDRIQSMSDEEVEEYCRKLGIIPTPCSFTLNDLFIVTKPPNSKLVRLEPNESQVMYLDDIQKASVGFDWRNGKLNLEGLRLDILKYRQWGCSTITIGLYLLDCMNQPHTQSRVIAHNPQTTQDLLGIARTMYDNFPSTKPDKVYDNRGEMQFSNGSSVRIVLVGSKGAGRGGTVKNYLLSERAFWPTDGNEIEFGLLQAVPPGGNIIRETTGNGLNEFYEQYKDAQAGRSEYRDLFYGWNYHKEYSFPVPKEFERTKEEESLQKMWGLTDGQLVFRRRKSAEAARLGKVFTQEYPLTVSEAFVGSSNSYYNNAFLMKLSEAMQAEHENEEEENLTLRLASGRCKHEPVKEVDAGENGFHAPFKVFKLPEPNKYYVICCDPAGGISRDKKQDHSSLHIFEVESWEECLHYHGDPDPWDFGLDAAGLAAWYNDAYVAVLRLNHGHEVIRALQEAGTSGIVTDEDGQYGLIENMKTKPILDDKLGTTINEMAAGEPGLILHSVETVEELVTYSKLPGGKAGASGTAKDDRQSSLKGIVWQLLRDDRRYRAVQKEPPPPAISYLGGRS